MKWTACCTVCLFFLHEKQQLFINFFAIFDYMIYCIWLKQGSKIPHRMRHVNVISLNFPVLFFCWHLDCFLNLSSNFSQHRIWVWLFCEDTESSGNLSWENYKSQEHADMGFLITQQRFWYYAECCPSWPRNAKSVLLYGWHSNTHPRTLLQCLTDKTEVFQTRCRYTGKWSKRIEVIEK